SHLDGVFLSTTLQAPTVVDAVRTLAADKQFALTPIVLIVGEKDNLLADRVSQVDRRVGRVFAVKDGAADLAPQLVKKRDDIASRFGHRELSTEVSLQLALESARRLRTVAINRSPILDVRPAEA